MHKPHTLSEPISHLEDYTLNIKEQRIRKFKLGFRKKLVERIQNTRQEVLKPKKDNEKFVNNMEDLKGRNTVSSTKEPFKGKFREYTLLSLLLC